MDFPESVKKEARQRAHYACVWCQRTEYFLEVHHVVPQEEEGPATIDNAAPLCPQCHTHIGPNPDLRRQLRERRDWWWHMCASRTPPTFNVSLEQTNALYERVRAMEAQGQRTESALAELKAIVLSAEEKEIPAVSEATKAWEVAAASTALRGTIRGPIAVLRGDLTVWPSTHSRKP